jgi:flagellar hook assembly protein FlgD
VVVETGIRDKTTPPGAFRLRQNYPNPFNPSTMISFQLPSDSRVTLVIHNVLGQKVKTLADVVMTAGEHSRTWDGTDDGGGLLSSGVYICRLTTLHGMMNMKMLLIR